MKSLTELIAVVSMFTTMAAVASRAEYDTNPFHAQCHLGKMLESDVGKCTKHVVQPKIAGLYSGS